MTDSLICSLYGLFSVLLGYIIKSGSINELHTSLKYSIEGLDLLSLFQHSCGAFKYQAGYFSNSCLPLFMFWKLLLLSSLLIVHKPLKFMVFSWPCHAPSGGVGPIAMRFPHIGMLWTHLPRHWPQLLLLYHASLGAFA